VEKEIISVREFLSWAHHSLSAGFVSFSYVLVSPSSFAIKHRFFGLFERLNQEVMIFKETVSRYVMVDFLSLGYTPRHRHQPSQHHSSRRQENRVRDYGKSYMSMYCTVRNHINDRRIITLLVLHPRSETKP
jgi:hypothetical protein